MWKLIVSLCDWFIRRAQYKSRFENKLDTVLSNQAGHDKRLLRLEILEAMRRGDRATVHQLYDDYKAQGGNSYMNELYKEFCKEPKKRSKLCRG